ncbi:gamma-glutamyltranspeptidase [Geothrix oryzae]|uniref:Glutathione hydrolase proenzyme n=1 Tax=Geothrix oryzae TaxID=2927975 RepID=A0ABN6UUP0_9BACT|nr:gamma-glutamyltransferase [Geothrix oryzae]BDU68474.1 gamma-glutamyltranspeptidase [Geothrix oryzae]
MRIPLILSLLLALAASAQAPAGRPRGGVVSQERLASEAGAQVLREGGSAVDAAVATAFALAVVHPAAGNLGGGGFLLSRSAGGRSSFVDFRETAPAAAHPRMWQKEGAYDEVRHHQSLAAVGVPGTVAGLREAWKREGRLPWARLLRPAIRLAREGFVLTENQAASLAEQLPAFHSHAPTLAQFSRKGEPYRAGDRLVQRDLARTLARLSKDWTEFYRGRTAALIVRDMKAGGGLITASDLRAYRPVRREPLRGTYRGLELLAAPPPSSGGQVLIETLNMLEGYDLKALGAGSPAAIHLAAEALRRAFADRAQHLGDPAFNPELPLARLLSKAHAAELRATISLERASASAPDRFTWPKDRPDTTHLSVVDRQGNAVSLTYTLEDSYGLKRIVPGAGFLLNNELGDFNAAPGLTDATGRIGTAPNLAQPGKRPLSSMCPVILVQAGAVFMVSGSPGGRTIPSTVLNTVLQVVDFGQDARAAVDAPRFHHQWLPDRLQVEADLPTATREGLKARGHVLKEVARQGCAQVILVKDGIARGAADAKRWPDSGVATE